MARSGRDAREIFGEVEIVNEGSIKTEDILSSDSATTAILNTLNALLDQQRLANLYLSILACGKRSISDIED